MYDVGDGMGDKERGDKERALLIIFKFGMSLALQQKTSMCTE